MMNWILLGLLFFSAVWLGSIIMGVGKKNISHDIQGNLFTISYRGRILYITGDRDIRLVKYTRVKNIEHITIPTGRGKDTTNQVESFMFNSRRTSKLVKRLFYFSTVKSDSMLQFDSEYAKELIEIKDKLRTFCK